MYKTKQRLKTSFMKALCYSSLICKKDRDMRAQRRMSAVFEDSLDICKLVDDHFKLNLLIDTLLTSYQKFLFFNQSSKVVHLDDPRPKSHQTATSHSIWEQDENY